MDDISLTYTSADCYSFDLLTTFNHNLKKKMTGNDRKSVSSPRADVLNDAKTGEFIDQNKNINTAKKTKTDL